MSRLNKDFIFLLLQFLDDEKYKETRHKLERESGLFFNMKYFEDAVTNGEWEEVENYLSGFTKLEDNKVSRKIFFEIRKLKYLEALDRQDGARALEILNKELKVFSSAADEAIFKEMTMLLTLSNFREHKHLSGYVDAKSTRALLLVHIKTLINANPLLKEKLQFPTFENSRLRTLLNQSFRWQHLQCKNPNPIPFMDTFFENHVCEQPSGAQARSPVINPLMGSNTSSRGPGPFNALAPYEALPSSLLNQAFALEHMSFGSTPQHHQAVYPGHTDFGLTPPINAASMLKLPMTPPTNNPALDYQTAASEHVTKRSRLSGLMEENSRPVNDSPINLLPKTVVANLNVGSAVKSMDFHPVQQALLLVGTNIGEISIWEGSKGVRIAVRKFKVLNLRACSKTLQVSLANEYTASVNRVMWSPDGNLFGVAYSKHIVHLFAYNVTGVLRIQLEIDAHVGSVNDLAFYHVDKHLCVITCGEDKMIKVWLAANGVRQYMFEGHEAPVYSICPGQKGRFQFLLSTDVAGKIKAWLYANEGARVNYDALGSSYTTMAYSADMTRLFSCGRTNAGKSYLVEWNHDEGTAKRTYFGLGKWPLEGVQFDTTKNRVLAAGDEFKIKFWDMDNVNILMSIDAGGDLLEFPRIRFSKDGTLLSVSTRENGIKILASNEGIRLMHYVEDRAGATSKAPVIVTFGASGSAAGSRVVAETSSQMGPVILTFGASGSAAGSRVVAETSSQMGPVITLNAGNSNLPDPGTMISHELDESKIWKLAEIDKQSQLRSLMLPDNIILVREPVDLSYNPCAVAASAIYNNIVPVQIIRLTYTNSGSSILALASNAIHKLWKWQQSESDVSEKATTTFPPQLWLPSSGILMVNDISNVNFNEAVPCFVLSKNDGYVVSASGGKISQFEMRTFKTKKSFNSPPPAATCLAIHPKDNNVIAIGMDDSSIQIYNVHKLKVEIKLKTFHQKRITGLAFSSVLDILVSSDADTQVCVWPIERWETIAHRFLQIPTGYVSNPYGETHVQFRKDEKQILVVHETQLATYEAPNLECTEQWVRSKGSPAITDATYSCDGQSVFSCFRDGSVNIFTYPELKLRCRINPAAYLPSSPSLRAYPTVIAAHPSEPNQFALGTSDGRVHVLEPTESEGQWGTAPP